MYSLYVAGIKVESRKLPSESVAIRLSSRPAGIHTLNAMGRALRQARRCEDGMMRHRYRAAWRGDATLERIASERLHGMGTVGELIEAWVWNTSASTCQKMLAHLSDVIDLVADAPLLEYRRLWVRILQDRVAMGDKL